MSEDTFRDRLQLWLDREGNAGEACGIDLGTTKSCAAIATYDADTGELKCECVSFDADVGENGIAVPSAVALDEGRILAGSTALAKRGKKGFLPERTFFYETKNTIGLRYTYPNARPRLANATDIATHVLSHLRDCVYESRGEVPDATPVVACPASFHAAQRHATMTAGWRAFRVPYCSQDDRDEMPLSPEDDDSPNARAMLIDEPYAAFLDLLFRQHEQSNVLLKPGNTLMVFDFGGGTCDVAIFRVGVNDDDPIGARLLATSRYHRLGGGDIDRAIVHEVLIPQIIKENSFGQWELTWLDKSKRLEPALISAAESLKIRMSQLLSGDDTDPEVRKIQAKETALQNSYEAGEYDDDSFHDGLDALFLELVTASVLAEFSSAQSNKMARRESREFENERKSLWDAYDEGELSKDEYDQKRRAVLLDQSVARVLARFAADRDKNNFANMKLRDFDAEKSVVKKDYDNGDLGYYEYQEKHDALLQAQGEAIALTAIRATHAAQADASLPRNPDEVALPSIQLDVEIGGVSRRVTLKKPSLDRQAFLTLLKPFLDPEPPPESGDEYVQRSSIFSPVKQALLRAGLEPDDIDGVLMCGCSSMLPPMQDALRRHFSNAACALLGRNVEELQGAVARGAALQALARHLLGRDLIEPVCSSELSLVVTTGTVSLAKAGNRLPAASNGSITLHPPRSSDEEDLGLAVEIVADGKQMVGRTLWSLAAPVSEDDTLTLTWSLDENQCLELKLMRGSDLLEHRFDSPVTHHDMSHIVRWRMLERMEAIRSGGLPRTELGHISEKIARDAAALGEYERALHFVGVALQERGDEGALLNLRGVYRQNLGDKDGAFDSYTKAAEQWTGARFNLALMHYRAGRYPEALKAVDVALEDEPVRAYRVLRGDILDKLGREPEARREWQDAVAGQIDFMALDEFDLGWLDSCAQRVNQEGVREKIREARERKAQRVIKAARQGELPVYAGRPLHDPSDLV